MESTLPDPKKTETSERLRQLLRILWKVLRWIPLVTMLLTIIALLVVFLRDGMPRITAWYLFQLIPPVLGLVSLLAIVVYIIIKRRFSKLLIVTSVIAVLSLLPAILLVVPVIAYPASLESTTPAATVRLPANVPLKVLWGGDSLKTNYHASVPDQRWAYDLLVEPYNTGSDKLEDYGCYGTPVVAPASGLVTTAHDGEPDAVPGVLTNNFEVPTGNHIAIQLESGTYLILAHLKEGSLLVKEGESVEEGQEIAQCGNSGNTSEPHIHIHHQRQDPNEFPVNFAEGLPLYFRDHDGAPMPVGGIRTEGDTIIATGDIVQHIGK